MITPRTSSFTLLELVTVMVVLIIVVSLVGPRLTGFFQGRQLDNEARRLWALTRFAREQAITAAVPVRLWLDAETRTYGLEAVPGYGYQVTPREYMLPDHLSITASSDELVWWPDGALTADSPDSVILTDARKPESVWTISRQVPLATYTLNRGSVTR